MQVKFECFKARVLALLSDGTKEEVTTALITYGDYERTYESLTDIPEHGKQSYVEQNINTNLVEPMFEDEWEYTDGREQKNLNIVKILEIYESDWEVDPSSL